MTAKGMNTAVAVVRNLGWAVALAVSAAMLSPAAMAEDYRVQIINQASQPVYNFYATNVNVQQWGRDHLGDNVLMPGQSVTIDFDDGTGECMFDFKIVFKDHSEIVRRNINVCQISTYTIRD